MSFDKKLKELRLKNEMTQLYVANRLNVARSTIAGYETKNRQPSHEKLTALANLFNVSVDYLLDGDDTFTLDASQTTPQCASEQSLLLRYRQLSSRSKENLTDYLELLELRDRN